MPVDTLHKDYTEKAPGWTLMRQAAGGQRAIHAAGEVRLPKLTGEKPEAYKARQARASWYNATYRTIEGLVGMLFRKSPVFKVSPGTVKHLADVTKRGESAEMFTKRVAEEYETVGRVGVLTDYPADVPSNLTVAAAESQNIRPHWALYQAEDITNWRYEWVNNRTMLTRVHLKETAELAVPGDEFAVTVEPRWRVLDLVPAVIHGVEMRVYRVRVFRKNGTTDEQVGQDVYPLMNGKPLAEIPFEVIGDGLPPLEDLANVNVSHYQTTADLEHGAHRTALPQLWIAGVQPVAGDNGKPEQLEFTIGGDAWVFPEATTVVGYAEYTGQGLGSLENRLVVKQQQMAVLGARMLEEQKRGVESGEAAGIHRSGEQSTLQTQADVIGAGMKRPTRWFDTWSGGAGGDDIGVTINKDFFPRTLDAQGITAIVAAWQAGALSEEEKFYNFQKGGIVSDGTDFEMEQTRISQNPPALLTPAEPAVTEE